MISTLSSLIFFFSFFALIAGLIKPQIFKSLLKERTNRKMVAVIFGGTMFISLIITEATAPPVEETTQAIHDEPGITVEDGNSETFSPDNEKDDAQTVDDKQLQEMKERLTREIDGINDFDGSTYHSSPEMMQIEIALFYAWNQIIVEASKFDDPELQILIASLENKVSNIQTTEFPLMRKAYSDLMDEKMWEYDIDIKVLGSANGTIEITGALFASNSQIKEFHQTISEALRLYRFDRVNYKWYKYDNDYTYFDLESDADKDLVELSE